MKANIFHKDALNAAVVRDTDLTGAFAADPHACTVESCWCRRNKPSSVETAMGEIRDRLTELARAEVERCACDESLVLRDLLAKAARGTYALHVVKEEGYWSVERWRDGEMVESYVGLETIADALDRIGEWMR